MELVLVKKEVLPEALQKTLTVKQLLQNGNVATVQEAVDLVGLSRSSYYKYKDHVFPFHEMVKEKIITLSFVLEHRSGVLSEVLQTLASNQASVLTINQTIPLQGEATVSMSVDTGQMSNSIDQVMDACREINGVRRVTIVGSGEPLL